MNIKINKYLLALVSVSLIPCYTMAAENPDMPLDSINYPKLISAGTSAGCIIATGGFLWLTYRTPSRFKKVVFASGGIVAAGFLCMAAAKLLEQSSE